MAPAELEALLLTHPNVDDAAVIGVPDQRAGEFPKAYVVTNSGPPVSEEEIQDYIAGKKLVDICYGLVNLVWESNISLFFVFFFFCRKGGSFQATERRCTICGFHTKVSQWKDLERKTKTIYLFSCEIEVMTSVPVLMRKIHVVHRCLHCDSRDVLFDFIDNWA